jgi:hypothetical protein
MENNDKIALLNSYIDSYRLKIEYFNDVISGIKKLDELDSINAEDLVQIIGNIKLIIDSLNEELTKLTQNQ